MTLRLDGELAERLAIVAQVDGQSITETIRIALANYLPQRLNLTTPPGDPSPTPST